MHKASVVAVFAGLSLLVGCFGAVEAERPAEDAAPQVDRGAPPTTGKTESAPASASEPEPPSATAPTPTPPALDPKAVKEYCADRDANRPVRGSFTGQAKDVDVTAAINADADGKHARLSIRVELPPTKEETKEHGLVRSESWHYTNFTIATESGKDAFAVGTYEQAAIGGSGGGNICYADGGHGGSSAWGADPVKLVITKRTADVIEGSFGDTSFSAVFPPPVASPPPSVCCL